MLFVVCVVNPLARQTLSVLFLEKGAVVSTDVVFTSVDGRAVNLQSDFCSHVRFLLCANVPNVFGQLSEVAQMQVQPACWQKRRRDSYKRLN